MSLRLTEIDDLIRRDHYYLDDNDKCYFLGEYTARRGYSYSDTNQLIYNFKKSPLKKGMKDWHHKERAIETIARTFTKTIKAQSLRSATLVPIPPSKAKSHPEYDDRLLQVLHSMEAIIGEKLDIRELITQTKTMVAAHDAPDGDRPKPDDLIRVYSINDAIAEPRPNYILVVDDLITAGSHFKAIKDVLSERYPDTEIIGLFVARRVPETEDPFDDFDFE